MPTLSSRNRYLEETSDGYHTFNELYDHRAKLFSVIVRCFKDKAWKSKLHYDGTMYDGMFIVGIETPEGQATYHYDIDPKGNSRYVVLALEDFYGNRRTELVRPSQLLIVDEPNVEGDSIRAIDDDSKHAKAYDYCCRWQIPEEFVPKDNGLFSKTYNYERGKRNHLRWRRARVMGWFEDDFETWSRGIRVRRRRDSAIEKMPDFRLKSFGLRLGIFILKNRTEKGTFQNFVLKKSGKEHFKISFSKSTPFHFEQCSIFFILVYLKFKY